MFKNALSDLKTSAPLKNSDRRKLKERVLHDFNLGDTAQLGDLLVPDGIKSVKFTASGGALGVAYLSSEGEPLWFTLGKSSTDLIPTVYTLWKHPRLLPIVTTPKAVIPVLQNGADLMSAGVVNLYINSGSETSVLSEGKVVAISCYMRDALGAPLAVGLMATSSDNVLADNAKGKAVKVLHVFKDKLWEMGRRNEPPEPTALPDSYSVDQVNSAVPSNLEEGESNRAEAKGNKDESVLINEDQESLAKVEESDTPSSLDPHEVSLILRKALLQSLRTSLSTVPSSTFPLLASTFYTTYILPARPAYVPNSASTPIDIKHSSYKNLSAFLRAAEKEGLLRLKEPKGKGGKGGDVQVAGVNEKHPDVELRTVYQTIGEVEAKEERKKEREAKERGAVKEIVVTELWKPHQQSNKLFEECNKETSSLYNRQDVIKVLNDYISSKRLVNPHQQQFINIDDTLREILLTKGANIPEFMKRDELLSSLLEKMQAWYQIEVDGKEPIQKKGKLMPVSIEVKIRQGRKTCTLITGFEPFKIDSDMLAEELRHVCAGATAISDVPGKGKEVMVQGKHLKTVQKILAEKGVPERWIVCADLKKKKKHGEGV